MLFDFDKPQNRLNTNSVRWDKYEGENVLPLWVADMDFQSPPCVLEALHKRVNHGIFGYTYQPKQFNKTIANYLCEQYQWEVDPEWIVILPSVVSGLYTAVQQLTKPNETVVIPNPIYHHFRNACIAFNRNYLEISLELIENRWVYPNYINNTISNLNLSHQPNLALFCNPQNPGSTVFKEDELKRYAEFCLDNDLWICSDEIHAGLILDETKKHIPIASLSSEISKKTVTLMSLNKTFNFAGISLAWAVAENPFLRELMQVGLNQTIPDPSVFSYVASEAAMKDGEPWRLELLNYLRQNRDLITNTIKAMPKLKIGNIEATYLAWIDFSEIEKQDPFKLLLTSGLATSPGVQFGQGKYIRLNFGTQKELLRNGLEIIRNTIY